MLMLEISSNNKSIKYLFVSFGIRVLTAAYKKKKEKKKKRRKKKQKKQL